MQTQHAFSATAAGIPIRMARLNQPPAGMLAGRGQPLAESG